MPLLPPVTEIDHIQGNQQAPIELVEYGDYQCPYCGQAYPIIKQLQQEFGDQLKFVFRNFPLSKRHPQAKMAAIVAEAAFLQGKYWEMHDLLLENQKRLNSRALFSYANELALDIGQFEQALTLTDLAEKVDADFHSGMRSGVKATPTFFINGDKYEGSWAGNGLLDFIKDKYAR
ncbi:DsbA family protein [Spirosoma pollinicola]|uniref:Disulfide bond formation protein DsbA n=1 Tax=Spirosoma pollinicola TaxID=2057025 RepID=A0A2K8Z6Q3_9BACT|nr:thioredoxin domain-containing protein [Spirosoma pollinicola]AUD05567.1 disulfide bond formation protein DsbA [Spirosoma pollinicola]